MADCTLQRAPPSSLRRRSLASCGGGALLRCSELASALVARQRSAASGRNQRFAAMRRARPAALDDDALLAELGFAAEAGADDEASLLRQIHGACCATA